MKYLYILSLGFFISCSHSPKTKKNLSEHYSSLGPETSMLKRKPANTKMSTDLADFIKLVRSDKNYLKIPVGHKVEILSVDDNGSQTYENVYLQENKYGYFVMSPSDKEANLTLKHKSTIEEYVETIKSSVANGYIKSIRRKDNKFIIENDLGDETCVSEISTKSYFDENRVCKDTSGKITTESKTISIKEVDLKQYEPLLRDSKITIRVKALQNKNGIYTTVESDQAQDWWSFLFED